MSAILDALSATSPSRDFCKKLQLGFLLQYRDYRNFWLVLDRRWRALIQTARVPWISDPVSCPLHLILQDVARMDSMTGPVFENPQLAGVAEVIFLLDILLLLFKF